MNAVNPSTISFTIKLESEDYAPEDSEWQEECHKFYLQLKNALYIGTVEPLKVENKEKGYRCFEPSFWHTFSCHFFECLAAEAALGLGLSEIIRWGNNFIIPKRNIKITLESSDGRGFVPRLSWRAKDMKDLNNNDYLYNELCAKHCLEKKPCLKECFIKQIIEKQVGHQHLDKL